MPGSNLPKGWAWKKIGDVVQINYGNGLPKRQRKAEGNVPVYGSNGKVGNHDSAITKGPTIVIGRKGSIGEVHLSREPCWPIDTTYFIDSVPGHLSVDYLYYFLKSLDLGELNRAAAIPGIRREDIYCIEMPLPPLEEQRRIVARIEELMHRINQAKSLRRESIEDTSAILSCALSQIFENKRNGWVRKRLKEVAETTSGGTPSRSRPDYFDGDIPWLKSGELEDDFIEDAEERITEEALNNSNAKVFSQETLLVALYGATVGRTAILKIAAATNQAVCAIFPDKRVLERDFAFWFLRYARPSLVIGSVGGAQPNISQKVIRELEIPLPPLDEQRRIVTYLNGLQEKVNELQRLQSETDKELESLTQSILKKAFRGKL